MIVVVTNLGVVSYLVKTGKYDFEKAKIIFREAAEIHNKSTSLNSKNNRVKGFSDASKYFIGKCSEAGLLYDNK